MLYSVQIQISRQNTLGATTQKKQTGETMMSVLISLLIISVGLYSGMRLQITSLMGIQAAKNRTQATLLASDIAERMNINIAGTLANQYDGEFRNNGQSGSGIDCSESACDAEQLAQFDLSMWQESFPDSLYRASAIIEQKPEMNDSDNPEAWKIMIQWDDDRNGSAGTQCPPVVLEADDDSQTDLDCVVLEVSFK